MKKFENFNSTEKDKLADKIKKGKSKYEKGETYTVPPGTEFYINGRYVTVNEPTQIRIDSTDYNEYHVTFLGDEGVDGFFSGYLKKTEEEKYSFEDLTGDGDE